MGLKLTPKFTESDIRNLIRQRVETVQEVIMEQLIDVAEQFVADARSTNTYKDHTSNLRGSIGYTLFKNGKEVAGSFQGTVKGQEKAQRLVHQVNGGPADGFTLIVVAGMNYAVYVESKGYDVLTGSSQTAETAVQRAFDRLKTQLSKIK